MCYNCGPLAHAKAQTSIIPYLSKKVKQIRLCFLKNTISHNLALHRVKALHFTALPRQHFNALKRHRINALKLSHFTARKSGRGGPGESPARGHMAVQPGQVGKFVSHMRRSFPETPGGFIRLYMAPGAVESCPKIFWATLDKI